ncbi:MAG: cysteine hydrolase [Simplicispira sp.]|nr:cysteine hydrolase [Simplicispira sp.]
MALVLVDFINPLDFDGADKLLAPALAAAQATARLKQRLAVKGVPAIYANDNYGIWQSDFRDVLQHCRSLDGERGRLAQLLAPGPQDLTVLKPRHSAFFATPLDMLLRQMGVQKIILVGLAADLCVHFTAVDAFMRGYALWIPADCVASETAQAQQAALAHMQRALKCHIAPSSGRNPFGPQRKKKA